MALEQEERRVGELASRRKNGGGIWPNTRYELESNPIGSRIPQIGYENIHES